MQKYGLLRQAVMQHLPGVQIVEAPAARDEELLRAHDADYIRRFCAGELTADEQHAIGFPWSEFMVERSRRSAGATLAACREALFSGVSVNLAGGTHHAGHARGEGFCCFNDAAVATRTLASEWQQGGLPELRLRRARHSRRLQVAIIDLDVHQGNGTAEILGSDPDVYTLSIHGERNYPFRKASGSDDVALPDGTGDADYLLALDEALARLDARFAPDLVIYLAGADPYEDDRLGRLSITRAGLAQRDTRVLEWCRTRRIPVALAMAGGYARNIDDTVAIQLETVRLALESHLAWSHAHA
jgi:acetoin utilization deacetylase AcuC-like enzyme